MKFQIDSIKVNLIYFIIVFYGNSIQISNKTHLEVHPSIIENITKKNIRDIISTFKSRFCVECTMSVIDPHPNSKLLLISMPCKCTICCEDCLNSYLKRILQNEETRCLCGDILSIKDIIQIYKTLLEIKESNKLETIKSFILFKFKTTCFICMENFDLYSDTTIHRVFFENEELKKYLHHDKFSHIICANCYDSNKPKTKKEIECVLCGETHKILKVKKKVNLEEDSDCIIF